jgi:hypothetical protein
VFNLYESQMTCGLAKFARNCSPKFEKKQRKAKKHNAAGNIERDVPTGRGSAGIKGLVPFIQDRRNQRHVYCEESASDTNGV